MERVFGNHCLYIPWLARIREHETAAFSMQRARGKDISRLRVFDEPRLVSIEMRLDFFEGTDVVELDGEQHKRLLLLDGLRTGRAYVDEYVGQGRPGKRDALVPDGLTLRRSFGPHEADVGDAQETEERLQVAFLEVHV